MPPLRVPAAHQEAQLSLLVVDLELLEHFCEAAAIQNRTFSYSTDVSIFIEHLHRGPVIARQAAVYLSSCFVWHVIVVVLADDRPWPMGGWQHDPMQQTCFLLEAKVYAAQLFIGWVCFMQFIGVGQIAGHEGESERHREGKKVIAVLERIRVLLEDEMEIIFETTPVKYHCQQIQMRNRLESLVNILGEDDLYKLFPQEYLSKYGRHLEIAKYADGFIFRQLPPAKPPSRTQSLSKLPEGQKLKWTDRVDDIVEKGRTQMVRTGGYLKKLEAGLKEEPTHASDTIRNYQEIFQKLPSDTLISLREIDQAQYEASLKAEKLKKRDDTVHFTPRRGERSSTLRLFRPVPHGLPPDPEQQVKSPRRKKDLVNDTFKIRQAVHQIEVLKRHDSLLRNRRLKEFIVRQ